MIEGKDGAVVGVTITEAWVERVQTKTDGVKFVVKLEAEDEQGRHGTATLWLTDEVRQKNTRSEVELSLEALEVLGMENADIENLPKVVGCPVDFRLWVREDDDGKVRTQYFLQTHKRDVVDLAEAAEIIRQIRGKAKKREAEVGGTPVQGDENMLF
jgi:hypothetical protein